MGRANAPGRAASYGRRQAALAALSRRALAGATLPDLAADSLDAVVAIVGVPLAAVITVEPQGHSPTILAAHGIPGGASDGSWIALTTVPRPTRHPATGAGSAGADVDAGASRATDPDSTADPSRTTDPDSTADPSRTSDASRVTDSNRAATPDGTRGAGGVSDPMLDPDALAARVAGALEAFARHDVAAAPVRYAGRPVAIVVAARRDRRDFTAGDRAFVGDVADLLSLALAHASDREATEVAHDARFQGLIDSDANGLLMVDEYGRIVEANRRAAELFGYEPRELVGTSIERLVPDRVRPIHARHRSTYVAAPATRPMGVGRDLTARRKDGTEFPVEIGLSSFPVAGRRLVTAIVADITSRKAAEIRARRE